MRLAAIRSNGASRSAASRRTCSTSPRWCERVDCGEGRGSFDPRQYRPQVGEEARRRLAHGEVADALHDHGFGALDAGGKLAGKLRRGGVIVLSGEQVE